MADGSAERFRPALGALVAGLKSIKVSPGKYIFQQDEEVEGLFVIKRGEVELVRNVALQPPECYKLNNQF
jgi:CRP-like cAMP-binding protein